MCKVKRFEKNLAKVVAVGTKVELNSILNKLEGQHQDSEPPKKKARLQKKTSLLENLNLLKGDPISKNNQVNNFRFMYSRKPLI